MKKHIKETASVGSVGAHAVAAAPSRLGATKKRNLKSFLINYYDGIGNKLRMFPVNLYTLGTNKKVKVVSKVNETFNLDSVFAQLSNYENKMATPESDVVSYGVEDDKGNLMKVTVLQTEADDFEAYISAYLSELKNFENNGVDLKDISLAELLYKLKDLFDIRDVEFPNIPEDIIYNADEASESVEGDEFGDEEDFDMEGGEDFPEGGEDFDMEGGDEFDMGGGEDFPEGEGEDFGDEFADDESVEDFEDFEDEDTTQSLLSDIISMLKAQAEEQTARYQADAEESKAKQAEFSAKAAEATLANKEEMIAMQAEKDSQKEREKAAKKQADLATYRYKKSRGMLDDANPTFEWFDDKSILMQALLTEEDITVDANLIRRQFMLELKALEQAIVSATSPEEKQALMKQKQLLPRKFMVKRQEAKARQEQKDAAAAAQQSQSNQQNQQQNQRPQANQQLPQQGQGAQQPAIGEGFITETISEAEYNKLEEAAKRQFKRYGDKFIRKFRCYGGPKDGRMVAKPSGCGMRKDPFKVRQGRKASRLKKGQRVRKTQMAKRKAPSKRLVRMNKVLRGDASTT